MLTCLAVVAVVCVFQAPDLLAQQPSQSIAFSCERAKVNIHATSKCSARTADVHDFHKAAVQR